MLPASFRSSGKTFVTRKLACPGFRRPRLAVVEVEVPEQCLDYSYALEMVVDVYPAGSGLMKHEFLLL